MKTLEITKRDCEAYERVRESGVTNMWNVDFVATLSGLDQDTIFYIMEHYTELNDKHHFRLER